MICGACGVLGASPDDVVVELTSETIESTLQARELAVVSFYAPWCAHCKRFEGDYARAAADVTDSIEQAIFFGRIDAAEHRDVGERYDVRGYPHIKLFRFGRFVGDYEGSNQAAPLAKWVKRRASPEVTQLDDWAGARAFLGKMLLDSTLEGMVIGVFGRNDSAPALRFARVAAADDDDGVLFALTTDVKLVAEQIQYYPGLNDDDDDLEDEALSDRIVFVSADDDVEQLDVDESTTATEMAAFVTARLTPLVTRFEASRQASLFYAKRGPNVHALLFVSEKSADAARAVEAMEAAAEDERDRVRHVIVPATEARVLKHFGLDPSFDLPALVLCDLRSGFPDLEADHADAADARDGASAAAKPPRDPSRMHTYRFSEFDAEASPLDVERILAFERALFEGGVLEPWLRSEETLGKPGDAPRLAMAANADGKIVHLTGKTFYSVVDAARADDANDSDFFVLFHAPWCGHCTALAPVWDALATLYKPVDSIVIAKMDATKNEIDEPGVRVRGFPTIYLFPADKSKRPVLYDHPHDLDSFSRFLKEKGTRSFDVDGLKGGGELKDEL